MPIPALAAVAGQAFSSFFGGPDAGGPVLSGGGNFAPGGLTIGSKVVGSGSAATTIPPMSSPGSGPVNASSSAGSGVPAWLPIAGMVVAALLVVALFIPRRRSRK